MWSDEEIDSAFRRLAPAEPEPESFPLDAWLRLEAQLDKDLMEQQFRLRLWKFFAGEMAVVALLALAWLLWPSRQLAVNRPEAAGANAVAARTGGAAMATGPGAAPGRRAAATRPTLTRQLPGSQPAAADHTAASNNTGVAKPAASAPSATTPAATAGGPALALTTTTPLLPTAGPEKRRKTAHRLLNPAAASQEDNTVELTAAREQKNTRPHPTGLAAAAAASRRHARPGRLAGKVGPTTQLNERGLGPRAGSRRRGAGLLAALAAERTGDKAGLTRKAYATQAADAAAKPTRAAKAAATTSPAEEGRLQKSGATAYNPAEGLAAPGDNTTLAAGALSAAAELNELGTRPVALLTEALASLPGQLTPGAPPVPAALPVPERQPRLYIGLLAAPDVSTVKMADYQSPKANLGLLVEYRLTSRLRLSSGLLRGTKVYRARREDYDWHYNPFAHLGKFKWVDGSCTILDVPLNLRYDLQQRPRYQVFATLGLSTLFMQREKYAYDYTYDSIPPAYPGYPPPPAVTKSGRWESEYVNENQHWFSVLNLSLGYERRLGQRWSLQAEPYLKLPLGGVGAGKVRLASGGVFFGVKYGL